MSNEDFEPMDINTKVSQSIVANQLALNLNEQIKFTDYYKHDLKHKLNLLLPILVKAEQQEYDKLFDTAEQPAVLIYDVVKDMVAEIAGLGIHHFECITEMVKAYKKDSKSINGIVNKINRK